MRVVIQSEMYPLAMRIANQVSTCASGDVIVEQKTVETSLIRYGISVAPSAFADLRRWLRPIELPAECSAGLPADEVRITLGGDLDLGAWTIMLHGDADRICILARSLRSGGFPQVRVSRGADVSRDMMLFGGAPAVIRQIVAWTLHPHGFCPVQQVEWPMSDSGIWLFVGAQPLPGQCDVPGQAAAMV